MKRFIIYSESTGYFNPSDPKSIFYNKKDFHELPEDSYLYVTEKTADKMCDRLSLEFETVVYPVDMIIHLLKPKRPTKEAVNEIKRDLHAARNYVAEVDLLTNAEVEALSTRKWNKYKKARLLLRTNDEAVND